MDLSNRNAIVSYSTEHHAASRVRVELTVNENEALSDARSPKENCSAKEMAQKRNPNGNKY